MNIPKLRFKEFTDEWKEYPLKYFTTPIKRKNTNNESDLPLTISSLDGLVDQRTYFNKVVASKDMSNYYLLKKGEFAYNKSYSVGFPFGSIKRLDKYNQGALSSLYICFQVNNMNSDFIVKYFESPKWHKQISLCVAEGARNHGLLNVNINDFFSTKHFLPQLVEQEKIAKFINTVDKKIENIENTISSLENQKKGLLQQIFSQKLRFKDENGNNYPNWKENIESIKILSGNMYPTTSYINKPGILLIQGINITPNKLLLNDCIYISNDYNEINHVIVKKGDILLGLNRPLINNQLKICLFDKDFAYLYQRAGILSFNKLKINSLFLYQYLQTDSFKKHLQVELVGSDQPYIKSNIFNKIKLIFPCLEEQTKIADFLSAFDRKLENQKTQLEHWQQIKKGLLQQMFV